MKLSEVMVSYELKMVSCKTLLLQLYFICLYFSWVGQWSEGSDE